MTLISTHTRFRAYQLKGKGSSFSYYSQNYNQFTLCEGRYCDDNKASIHHELMECNKDNIDVLHITSWDEDHCNDAELEQLLKYLKPQRIEYPGYPIDITKENQRNCLKLITKYSSHIEAVKIDSDYVGKLSPPTYWDYNDILCNNNKTYDEANNNSTIKLFKKWCFFGFKFR